MCNTPFVCITGPTLESNVNCDSTVCAPPVLLRILEFTSMLFAFTVRPSPPTISNVLSELRSPPPVKPAPAIKFLVNGAFVAIEFVKVVAKLELLLSAVAISFNVFKDPSAPSTNLFVNDVIAAST